MIIECDNCSTRFRLDENRVKSGGVKVRCTKCQNVFIVSGPEATGPEDPVRTGEGAGVSQPEAPQEEPPQEEPNEKPDEKEEDSIPELSFGELDLLSPAIDDQDKGVEEIVDSVYQDDFDTAPRPGPAGDAAAGGEAERGWPDPTDFSFDPEEPEAADVPDEGDSFFGILDDAIATGAEEPKAKEGAEGAAAPPPSPRAPQREPGPKFGAALTTRPPEKKKTVPAGAKAAPKGSPVIGIVIAVLIFIGGGAAIYFSGIIDTLSGAFITTAAESPVKIESIGGDFMENSRFGKVFVINASLSNITAKTQRISGVRATIYDKSGTAIEERTVAAGRVVSAEEIRTLAKKELLKYFDDASGATLPPKGSIPVMVPFAYAGRSIAEYGIDVLR